MEVTRAALRLAKKRAGGAGNNLAAFDRTLEAEVPSLPPCASCGSSGVMRRSTGYPNLEDARCCLSCSAGHRLAGRLAEITAGSQLDMPARAA